MEMEHHRAICLNGDVRNARLKGELEQVIKLILPKSGAQRELI